MALTIIKTNGHKINFEEKTITQNILDDGYFFLEQSPDSSKPFSLFIDGIQQHIGIDFSFVGNKIILQNNLLNILDINDIIYLNYKYL